MLRGFLLTLILIPTQVDRYHCLSASTTREEEMDGILPWEKNENLNAPRTINTTTVGARKQTSTSR